MIFESMLFSISKKNEMEFSGHLPVFPNLFWLVALYGRDL